MPELTLGEVAARVHGTLIGDPSLTVSNVAELKEARQGDLTFLADAKLSHVLLTTTATAVLVSKDILPQSVSVIQVDDPRKAFFLIVHFFRPFSIPFKQQIYEQAFVGEDCTIGTEVTIGPFSFVGHRSSIGSNTLIFPSVYIGEDVVIGKDCIIYPHVCIRERTVIGDRVIISAGAVLGSGGFGFSREGTRYQRIPQTGKVVIEDDVEIGANCTIDRATISETRIGRGTKLDNLVHIAHNVHIGEDGVMAAQVGIAGSTKIGNNIVFGGQVGVVDHITIGDDIIVSAGGGISKSLKTPGIYWGRPAGPIEKIMRLEAYFRRLPDLFKKVNDIEKRINNDK